MVMIDDTLILLYVCGYTSMTLFLVLFLIVSETVFMHDVATQIAFKGKCQCCALELVCLGLHQRVSHSHIDSRFSLCRRKPKVMHTSIRSVLGFDDIISTSYTILGLPKEHFSLSLCWTIRSHDGMENVTFSKCSNV